jgi:hypothetical protein
VTELTLQQVAQQLSEEIEIIKDQHQYILNELEYVRRLTYWKEKFQAVPNSSPKAVIGRTCEEIYHQDTTLPSGNYFIDPDGPEGDESFLVYCNMTNSNSDYLTT